MSKEAATHSGSAILFLGHGQDLSSPEQAMEISMALRDMSPSAFLGSSGIPTALGLEHAERLHTQQQIIAAQQRIIATQYREITRLQQLVSSMSQALESALNTATEPEEELELDYSAMEAEARLRAPSGVNWKTASRPKSYSEIMDVRYDPDAEER